MRRIASGRDHPLKHRKPSLLPRVGPSSALTRFAALKLVVDKIMRDLFSRFRNIFLRLKNLGLIFRLSL